MTAVVGTPAIMQARPDVRLTAAAANVVQPNLSGSRPIVGRDVANAPATAVGLSHNNLTISSY